jgi:hypothetical protein
MMIQITVLASMLSLTCGAAQVQVEPPLDVDLLTRLIGDPRVNDPSVNVPALTREIQSRGISFNLENYLTQILRAGLRGKRDPDEMAALVLAGLHACQDCRTRMLTPMTKEELLTLKKWRFSTEAILDEARIRGVKDIEITESAANELRSAGFSEDLVTLLVPDDKVPVAALEGYVSIPLKRSDEYNPAAPEGFVKVTSEVPAKSQSEFVFKHNRLFAKAVNGKEPKDVSGYFNKPAPRNAKTESVRIKWGAQVTDKETNKVRNLSSESKSKGKPEIEVSYLESGPDDRSRFLIRIANEHNQQQYSFWLVWTVVTTPKTSSASPK